MFKFLCAIWYASLVGFATGDKGPMLGFAIAVFIGVPMALAFFAGIEFKDEK